MDMEISRRRFLQGMGVVGVAALPVGLATVPAYANPAKDPKSDADGDSQSWDVPNLFVLGSSNFPQNAGYNPTETVGALTHHAAEEIRRRYLRNPGPLV